MPKENQRVAVSKKLLKNAIVKILKKKNIKDISIRELCEEAEINRTTFYRHYDSPHDVLIEIELEFVKSFLETYILSDSTKESQKYITYMCEYMYENKETVTLFIRNNTDIDFTQIFQSLSEEFLSSRTVLYKGHAVDEDTMRLMKTLFSHGIYAVVRQWLIEDIPKSPDEISELLYSSFIRDFTFE